MNFKSPVIGKRDTVKNYVFNYILENELKPGDRILTQQMIADELKVNTLTVNHALTDLVADKIIYRIQGKGTFVGGEKEEVVLNSNIALVLPDFDMMNAEKFPDNWHIWAEILPAFSTVLGSQRKFTNVIIDPGKSMDGKEEELQQYDVVFFPNDVKYISLVKKMITMKGTPVICLGNGMRDLDCLHVWVSPFENMKKGVLYLANQGFEKIAYGGSASSLEKIYGFKAGIEIAGLKLKEENIFKNIRFGKDVSIIADAILKGEIKCDAVVMDNDIKAVYLIEILRTNGKSVPGDVSVLGFDGIKTYMQGPPFLSTINAGYENVLKAAVALINEGGFNKKQLVQIVGNIVKGKTVKNNFLN